MSGGAPEPVRRGTAAGDPDPAGGTAAGRVLADDPAAWTPTAAVYAAAARITSLYEAAQALAASIEAQVMEALHLIREACPDEDAFSGVVSELTPLRPAEALRMAQTWEVVRRQRDLRQLAATRPREAMGLVRGLLEAAPGAGTIATWTADDAAVAAVLALPPRARNARIRELVRGQGGTGDAPRAPADVERIAELEAQVDALRPAPRLVRWREVVERVRDAEADLAEAASDVADLAGARAGVPAATAARLLRLADSAQASLDAVSGALLGRSAS